MIPFIQINNYESERLVLRNLEKGDAQRLFEIYSDKEAMKYRHSRPMIGIKDANDFISNQQAENEDSYTLRKGVVLKEKNELIGSVLYKFNKRIDHECVIGYSIGVNFWNRGFGREIVKLLVESLKEQKSISVIKAWTIKENIASSKILELNDFKRVDQNEFAGSYLYLKNI